MKRRLIGNSAKFIAKNSAKFNDNSTAKITANSTENSTAKFTYTPPEIPDELKAYAVSLRVLENVPFSYLVSDLDDLPCESIRFFRLDLNWTDALIDGAFSIGRVIKNEYASDRAAVNSARVFSADTPRMRRMHKNHTAKNLCANRNDAEDFTDVTGFIMNSELTARCKGVNITASDKDKNSLVCLRLSALSDRVMLGLFHGEIENLTFEEPKQGLSFGSSNFEISGGKFTRSIDLRSPMEEDFGTRIGSFCIDNYTEENGKLNAAALAKGLETALKNVGKLDTIALNPSRFSYEMIAVAHRAEFHSSDKAGGETA
jgi:hypothetical protein